MVKTILNFNQIRQKVQPVKVQEMTRPTLPAEDAEKKPSIDNINPAVLVAIPEQKPEDVNNLF